MTDPEAVTDPESDVEIRDNAEVERYELVIDGVVRGYVDYRRHPHRTTILHTEIDAALDGRGFGSRLARFALDDARARGDRIAIFCPFVRTYVQRHPEYEALVIR